MRLQRGLLRNDEYQMSQILDTVIEHIISARNKVFLKAEKLAGFPGLQRIQEQKEEAMSFVKKSIFSSWIS